jgi:electron transport complex protein RnfD
MAENYIAESLIFSKPQINLARSATERMWLVSLCALMAVLQSSLSDSYSSLLVALSAVFAAVFTEFIILHKSGRIKALKDGSAVACALILSLLLPNRISPFYAAAGAVFSIAVIKHSFGGLGSNWVNPAAGGWLFIRLSWSASFKAALEGSPFLAFGESFGVIATPIDSALRSFFNGTIFSLAGAELPAGYFDLFAYRYPGIIADRAVFALLLGTIVLSAFQVSRSWIPAVYLAVFGIFVRAAGALPYGGTVGNGDVLFAFCSGGSLAAAFFLSADPATGAKSKQGILLATAAGGGLAFIFRYPGAEPYGAVFAALAINALLPLVRIIENRNLYEKQGAYP